MTSKETLARFIIRNHPHSVLVNFSFAYLIAAGIFSILYTLTGIIQMELAPYYMFLRVTDRLKIMDEGEYL